jgi:uncharacterized integral membrane protein
MNLLCKVFISLAGEKLHVLLIVLIEAILVVIFVFQNKPPQKLYLVGHLLIPLLLVVTFLILLVDRGIILHAGSSSNRATLLLQKSIKKVLFGVTLHHLFLTL